MNNLTDSLDSTKHMENLLNNNQETSGSENHVRESCVTKIGVLIPEIEQSNEVCQNESRKQSLGGTDLGEGKMDSLDSSVVQSNLLLNKPDIDSDSDHSSQSFEEISDQETNESTEQSPSRSDETLYSNDSEGQSNDLPPTKDDSDRTDGSTKLLGKMHVNKEQHFESLMEFEPSYSPESSESGDEVNSSRNTHDDQISLMDSEIATDPHFDEQDKIQLYAEEEDLSESNPIPTEGMDTSKDSAIDHGNEKIEEPNDEVHQPTRGLDRFPSRPNESRRGRGRLGFVTSQDHRSQRMPKDEFNDESNQNNISSPRSRERMVIRRDRFLSQRRGSRPGHFQSRSNLLTGTRWATGQAAHRSYFKGRSCSRPPRWRRGFSRAEAYSTEPRRQVTFDAPNPTRDDSSSSSGDGDTQIVRVNVGDQIVERTRVWDRLGPS